MTEGEALKKWCPFVRVALMRTDDVNDEQQPVSPAYNRLHFDTGRIAASDGTERETLCLGSQCMAWRWATPEADDCSGAATLAADHPHLARYHPADRKLIVTGYCGLAGEPR